MIPDDPVLKGSLRHTGWWLAGTMAGYVFIPVVAVKFLCLVVGLGLASRAVGILGQWWLLALLATFGYAAAFLLNPFWAYWRDGQFPLVVQVLFVGLGCGWLWLAIPSQPMVRPSGKPLEPALLLLWGVLLAAMFLPTWAADVSYGGDEHYHMASAILCERAGRSLFGHWFSIVMLMGWLGAAWGMCRGGPTGAGKVPARPMWVWGAAGLGWAGLLAVGFYPEALLRDPFVQERTFRYPAAQPWFSALLGSVCFESWGRGWPLAFGLLRLVPLLALFGLGWVWAADRRWQGLFWGWRLLAALAFCSVPVLRYYGDVVYLELPMVLCLAVVLRDGRRWMWAGYPQVARRPSWWAMLALGFLKETGLVLALFLWLGRAIARAQVLRSHRHRNKPATGFLRGELPVLLAALGPGLLYLLLRAQGNVRPYQWHGENLWVAAHWWECVRHLAAQFGPVWFLALFGAVCLWRRQRGRLFLCGLVLGGMWAFHFCEEPRWIGLARFNLLLLPPVLVLAWEGLMWLARRDRRRLGLVLLLLLAGHWWLRPAGPVGRQNDWGKSGDRWYDWTACLSDLRRQAPQARLLLGNMKSPYALGLVLERIGWRPAVQQAAPAEGLEALADLQRTLALGAEQRCDFVIYRSDGALGLPENRPWGVFEKGREYPSRPGGLIVFRRGLTVPPGGP